MQEQTTGSIFGPFEAPHMTARTVGLRLPVRHPDHSDPEWFQLDLDDEVDDEPFDPLPTTRHRTLP